MTGVKRSTRFIALLVLALSCSSASVDKAGDTSAPSASGRFLYDTSHCTDLIDNSWVHNSAIELTLPNRTYCLGALTAGASLQIAANDLTFDGLDKDFVFNSGLTLTEKQNVIVKNARFAGGVTIQGGGVNTILNSQVQNLFICRSDGNKVIGNKIQAGSGATRVVRIHGYGTNSKGDSNGDCGGPDHISSGNLLQGNWITGSDGWDARFLQSFYIRDNRILDNYFEMRGGGNIAQLHYSEANTIQGNYFNAIYPPTEANRCDASGTCEEWFGFVIRDGGAFNRVIRNEFHSNGDHAFLLNQPGNEAVIGHDNLIQSNRIILHTGVSNDSAFKLMTSDGNEQMENNVIYANSAPLGGIETGTPNLSSLFARYVNNTVYVKNGVALSFEPRWNGDGQGNNPAFYGTQILKNNIFFSENTFGMNAYQMWTLDASRNVYVTLSLGGYAVSYSGSSDIGRVLLTPQFVGVAALDFVLTPGSPTLGQGMIVPGTHVPGNVHGLFDDADLLPFSGTAPDIGAGDVQMPTRPTDVSATVSGADAVISWSSSTDNTGVTGYEVYSLDEPGPTLKASPSAGATSQTVSGLVANSNYLFFVRAKDAEGNRSLWSDIVAVTVGIDGADPTPIPTLRATPMPTVTPTPTPTAEAGDPATASEPKAASTNPTQPGVSDTTFGCAATDGGASWMFLLAALAALIRSSRFSRSRSGARVPRSPSRSPRSPR
ncbi:MAG: hypothetical protein V1798_10130 [Pseudomonadota bacterium]